MMEEGELIAMSETKREWKHLERRPGSSYKQLYVKGTKIWAWTLYCETMHEEESRTPEQLAEDFQIPLEAVQEAIAYCKSDPPEIHDDYRRDQRLAEAIGMNDPDYKYHGRPKELSTEDRVRLGL
jgi:uncharacterized protein (DUF433 family)